jgi:signal transduction histidine kinase
MNGLDQAIQRGVVICAVHDPRVVALSVVISILGAYAALHLAERVRDSRGRWRLPWLAGAATVDGIGTWSMHYTGKLALRLPVPLRFDWRMVLLSLLVGIAGSAAALLIVGGGEIGWVRGGAAAFCLGGVGISGLHYTGMAAIRQPSIHRYHSPALMMLSVVLAIVVSSASLALEFRSGDDSRRPRPIRRHAVAILRGSANPLMHYTAMAAVVFVAAPVRPSHTVSIASFGFVGISIVPVTVLVVALLTSVVDRLQKQRALLDELFEQGPLAVALMTDDDRIVRVNREFARMFETTPRETTGRPLSDFHGTRLNVAMLRVPVSLPGGEVQIYAILRDVTAEKKAEEALRALPRRLMETQEAEGKRIARELHDEIGQLLTGVGMLLSLTEKLSPTTQARLTEAQAAVKELSERTRALALDLSPAILDDFGLIAALESLLQRYTRQTGVAIDFTHAGLDGARMRSELEITAYRIVQEALTNVARHAQVREAFVKIEMREDALLLEVEDRGVGFDEREVAVLSSGLTGMRERATILGGRLTVTTFAGEGTRIHASLPLREPIPEQ